LNLEIEASFELCVLSFKFVIRCVSSRPSVFGAMICSWMNDSDFTEKETLKAWKVAVTVNSLSGLAVCLVFSKLVPLI
jgi:H+/gluconate symporter-like permease